MGRAKKNVEVEAQVIARGNVVPMMTEAESAETVQYVSDEDAAREDRLVSEIRMITEQTKQVVLFNSIEIGRRLTEAKAMVKRGTWGTWLKERVDYSQRTANNFMKIYQEYGRNGLAEKSQALANLSYTQALALIDLPEDERARFAEERKAGEMALRKLQEEVRQEKEKVTAVIKCRAIAVGEDTTLSQIIKMVSDAAATKAPIAKIADKVSGVFVPCVIGVALVALCVWLFVGQSFGYALARGISVLVISCPCALGLATPVAVMVGNGKAAKSGILFKTAASLEETGRVQIVALDKTGTITKGEPKVTDVIAFVGENEFLSLAYSIEKKSEHPLAKAVCEYAKQKNVKCFDTTSFKALAGNGLSANVDGKTVVGGSMKFISSKISVDDNIKNKAEELAQNGKTPLLFMGDNKLLGIIAVADVIKEDSPKAIKELQNMGIRVVMLTGDNEKTAKAIGKQVGVDTVISDVLPDGKESVIKELMTYGKVAMVGDGINDAPALTRADVGIAIGAGTDVAVDAADVVLMNSKLTDVSGAIRLSRKTLTNIHENLFWAFIYNIIGIPLAAGVWIPIFGWTLNPMFGAAAMSLSSFCVVTNALRLNLVKVHSPKRDKKKKPVDIKLNITAQNKEEKIMTKTIKIEGMMCPHCEAAVKKALEAIDGVKEASASHEKCEAEVMLDKDVDLSVLEKAVTDAGYKVIK